MEKRYMISDAAKMVAVENHVLRYWEEELDLKIPRNEKGHRYYRQEEIDLLRQIHEWKEQGFVLKAIRRMLPERERIGKMSAQELYRLREEYNGQVLKEEETQIRHKVIPMYRENKPVAGEEADERLRRFEEMMKDMVGQAVHEAMKQERELWQKEQTCVLRQTAQSQETQAQLLGQILEELRGPHSEVAAAREKKARRGLFHRKDKPIAKSQR